MKEVKHVFVLLGDSCLTGFLLKRRLSANLLMSERDALEQDLPQNCLK